MIKPLILTPNGRHKLHCRLLQKELEYKNLRENRQLAFELSGDGWHDNPEFNRAQQMEANCNHEIKALNDQLSTAKILVINENQRSILAVEIGSLVQITRWFSNGQSINESWEITGHGETDQTLKLLAYDTPLGQLLLGMQVGDIKEEVQLGAGVFDLECTKLLHQRDETFR